MVEVELEAMPLPSKLRVVKKHLCPKKNMNVARYFHTLSAIGDILVAVGGIDKKTGEATKSCEVFLR